MQHRIKSRLQLNLPIQPWRVDRPLDDGWQHPISQPLFQSPEESDSAERGRQSSSSVRSNRRRDRQNTHSSPSLPTSIQNPSSHLYSLLVRKSCWSNESTQDLNDVLRVVFGADVGCFVEKWRSEESKRGKSFAYVQLRLSSALATRVVRVEFYDHSEWRVLILFIHLSDSNILNVYQSLFSFFISVLFHISFITVGASYVDEIPSLPSNENIENHDRRVSDLSRIRSLVSRHKHYDSRLLLCEFCITWDLLVTSVFISCGIISHCFLFYCSILLSGLRQIIKLSFPLVNSREAMDPKFHITQQHFPL